MHARTTTVQGSPERVDAGIAMVRDEVMPALEQMDGCVGLSMLVDRETGGAIVTSSWQDEQSMRATELRAGVMRDRAAMVFNARPEVREWEIAVLHRLRPTGAGACARVTWTKVDPSAVDQQLYLFRVGTLLQIEDLPGFCSASLLVDRASGTSALAVSYESREALTESRDPAMDLRADSTMRMGAQLLDVAEFEIALAHLRVPETV